MRFPLDKMGFEPTLKFLSCDIIQNEHKNIHVTMKDHMQRAQLTSILESQQNASSSLADYSKNSKFRVLAGIF